MRAWIAAALRRIAERLDEAPPTPDWYYDFTQRVDDHQLLAAYAWSAGPTYAAQLAKDEAGSLAYLACEGHPASAIACVAVRVASYAFIAARRAREYEEMTR
jgi:hypothetical protein